MLQGIVNNALPVTPDGISVLVLYIGLQMVGSILTSYDKGVQTNFAVLVRIVFSSNQRFITGKHSLQCFSSVGLI